MIEGNHSHKAESIIRYPIPPLDCTGRVWFYTIYMIRSLPGILLGFIILGYGESTAQIQGNQSSFVAEEDILVVWVLDYYSSMEDGFAEVEKNLRLSNVPVIEILVDFEEAVSVRNIQSVSKKKQLVTLRQKLEERKEKIKMLMEIEKDPLIHDSYGLAFDKINGKLDATIKPLLDNDFPNLEKFERDIVVSMIKWKENLRNLNDVLDEGQIRNHFATLISVHFQDNVAKPIEERRKKWGGAVKPQEELIQNEQIDGSIPFVDNLPKPTEERIPKQVEDVVEWVLDNYSSVESWFDEAENELRTSDGPVLKILDDLAKLVSGRKIELDAEKKQLIDLKELLEARKQKIKTVMEEADPLLKSSYGLALSEIEGKLNGKIKPLLEFDFPNLEKFEKDLTASMVKWKKYLNDLNGVLDENRIRKGLTEMISTYFRDNIKEGIEERRKHWASEAIPQSERPQKKEQLGTRAPFADNLARPHENSSQTENEILKPYPKQFTPPLVQKPVQTVEKNINGARFLDSSPSPAPRFEMIWVKPGSFAMGSPEGFFAGERGRDSDESQHQVTLTKGFYLGKYEVTQAQWVYVMGSNPSQFKGANRPVEEVSWHDAVEFCRKFTEIERRGGRLPTGMAYTLPTESQWEYACRSGTTAAFSFGKNLTSEQANISGGPRETTDVGKYPSNAWGFHDMHGNVWEWCSDWDGNYPKGAATDPYGSAQGSARITRGGSWDDSSSDARCAARNRRIPSGSYGGLGFRLCLRPVGL